MVLDLSNGSPLPELESPEFKSFWKFVRDDEEQNALGCSIATDDMYAFTGELIDHVIQTTELGQVRAEDK